VPGITCPLHEAAECDPAAPAIVAPHRQYTYGEYDAYVNGTMANLHKAGFGEGHLVCIALPPGTPTPILLMALFRLGAVAVPVNTRFPAQYLLDMLKRVRCKNMIVPYGASVTTAHGKLYALAPHDLVDDRIETDEAISLPLERPATIMLTSGSASIPKAALHSYGNHYHNALRSNRNIPVDPGDRWLLSLPLYHVAGIGILFRCLLGGGTVVFPGANEGMADTILKYRVTHVSLVPTQLFRLLQDPTGVEALRRLKAILLGGSAIPEALLRRAHEAKLPLFTTYGLTEMASQVATTRPGDPLDRLLTSGRPLAADSVRISKQGEILVRGKTRFLGYVSGSTLEPPFIEEGWFPTGDLGHLDAQGYLHVTGRRDSRFVAGGENIQPEEVEAALCGIEGVLEAVVVPVESEEFVATPVAFVRLESRACPDEALLAEQLGPRLPRYKIPRRFFPWPEEDPGEAMKISRQEWADRARDQLRAS